MPPPLYELYKKPFSSTPRYGLPPLAEDALQPAATAAAGGPAPVLFLHWSRDPVGDRDSYQGMAFAAWLFSALIGGIVYLIAGIVVRPAPGTVAAAVIGLDMTKYDTGGYTNKAPTAATMLARTKLEVERERAKRGNPLRSAFNF